MATMKEKIAVEIRLRELLASEGMPFPDRVEYGYQCVRLFWEEPKVAIVVDIDVPSGGEAQVGMSRLLDDDGGEPGLGG